MARRPISGVFPEPNHNHGSCETALLDRAGRVFETKGMKLTDLRRRVLEEIAASHEALGAYDILDRLSAKGTRLAPISVYRAIEALHTAGLVHRLESRNAFFACHSAHAPERDQVILACERCGRVAEIAGEQVFTALQLVVDKAQFQPRRTVTEISGTCANCRAGP
jgi:Fur family transcriptional regulator, zinc uptake regulator